MIKEIDVKTLRVLPWIPNEPLSNCGLVLDEQWENTGLLFFASYSNLNVLFVK